MTVWHLAAKPLLDHLISPLQKRRWDCEAESLGGLEIVDQLEEGRALDEHSVGLLPARAG